MCSCNYRDKLTCSQKVNSNIHDGTMLKIKAFKEYTNAWLEKVINNIHELIQNLLLIAKCYMMKISREEKLII